MNDWKVDRVSAKEFHNRSISMNRVSLQLLFDAIIQVLLGHIVTGSDTLWHYEAKWALQMQSHAGLGKCALPCSLSELFFVLQLRLPIPSVRILTFEFFGTIVRLTTPPLALIFFITWLVAGRDGQVHHEGTEEAAQETDPVDQDPLRRFCRVLRIFAENRSDEERN